jgi:hypothetical protein
MFRSAYFRARHWLARFFGPGAVVPSPPPAPPARLGDRGGVRLGAFGGVRLGEHGGIRLGRSRSW